MDIFFADPNEFHLPPNEVHILVLKATPLDERRVRVYLEIDPSQKRPSADLLIQDEQGNSLASASIIESMHRKMEIVMHVPSAYLRSAKPGSAYSLQVNLFFATLPEPGEGPDAPTEPGPIERMDADQAKVIFNLP
jgi:hypothetical protein